MLRDIFLVPHGITMNALAVATKVPNSRITRIVYGQCAISPDTAVRFAKFFGNAPEFWLYVQQKEDLRRLDRKAIESEVGTLDQLIKQRRKKWS